MFVLNTTAELIHFFNCNKMPVKGNIVTRTPVKMNKRDVATKSIANPHGAVYKVQTINVELNAQYETRVNTARMFEGKEQNFEVEDRKWGEHVNASIVKHGEELYLSVVEESKVGSPVYETENGIEVSYDDLKAFMPVPKAAAKQDLTNEIKVRTFKLTNVIGMFIPQMHVRYIGR